MSLGFSVLSPAPCASALHSPLLAPRVSDMSHPGSLVWDRGEVPKIRVLGTKMKESLATESGS